jgi:UDP-N-acetylmuramoylalanine--D-glutamate ligase
MSTIFSAKKILVVGLGISGQAAAHFLLAHYANVYGFDDNREMLVNTPLIQALQEKGLQLWQENDFHGIDAFDWIVLSPGISFRHSLLQRARQLQIPIMGEIELGCCVAKNPIFGITGTNGKTTVTLLITHILQTCQKSAHALGNVGIPFTQELLHLNTDENIVLELSSYQLETMTKICLDIGVILNITPDHLDRYSSLEEYAKTKCRIEYCLKSQANLYMGESSWYNYGHFLKIKKPLLYGYTNTCFIWTDLQNVYRNQKKVLALPTPLQDKKSHELENFLIAYAVCAEKGVPAEDFLYAWETFKKPSHRIEFIRKFQGIRYYDDSKGTNIDAVIRAVQFVDGPIILIVGGVDKGSSYSPWIESFKGKVKLICAIGQAANKIHAQVSPYFPTLVFESLEKALHAAVRGSEEGDAILLSPGCASYDMFKDYKHRGMEFQRLVHQTYTSVSYTTCNG